MPKRRIAVARTRFTVSLPTPVYGWSLDLVNSGAHSSLNELLADLVRRAREGAAQPNSNTPLPAALAVEEVGK